MEERSRLFQEAVIAPALTAPAGLDQLIVVCDAFFDHLHRRTFPGGCFFAGAVRVAHGAVASSAGVDGRTRQRRSSHPTFRHLQRGKHFRGPCTTNHVGGVGEKVKASVPAAWKRGRQAPMRDLTRAERHVWRPAPTSRAANRFVTPCRT